MVSARHVSQGASSIQAVAAAAGISELNAERLVVVLLALGLLEGAGVTLLPASAVSVEARPGNGVVALPVTGGIQGRTIALVWRKSDPRTDFYAEIVAPLAALMRVSTPNDPTRS